LAGTCQNENQAGQKQAEENRRSPWVK
jgi:hypothetical protein